MSDWIETKKECNVNELGIITPSKVTLEKKDNPWNYKPKEIIELLLRVAGLAAIAVPIFLFYRGQENERKKQKMLFQLEVYSKTATDLQFLLDEGLDSVKPYRVKLFNENYPKLILLNEKPIIDTFNEIKDIINFYTEVEGLNLFFKAVIDKIDEHITNKDHSNHAVEFNFVNSLGLFLEYSSPAWRNKVDLKIRTAESEASKIFLQEKLDLYYQKIAHLSYLTGLTFFDPKNLPKDNPHPGYLSFLDMKLGPHIINEDRILDIRSEVVRLQTNYFQDSTNNDFISQLSPMVTHLDSMMVQSNSILYSK